MFFGLLLNEVLSFLARILAPILAPILEVPFKVLVTIAAVYWSLVGVIRWKMSRNPDHPSNLIAFLGQLLLVLAMFCCQKAMDSYSSERFQSFVLYGLSQYLTTACMLLTYDFRRAPNLLFASFLCAIGLIGLVAGVFCVKHGEIEMGKFPVFLGLYVNGVGATLFIMSRVRGEYPSHIKCK